MRGVLGSRRLRANRAGEAAKITIELMNTCIITEEGKRLDYVTACDIPTVLVRCDMMS